MIPKFRAWDKIKKNMHEVQAIVYIEEKVYPIYQKMKYRYIPFDEAILMQSTGLFDKNSKEIFEGDIIEWWYSKGEFISQKGKFEVVWENGAFCPGKDSDETLFYFLECCEDDWYSVVGNIYENPELLEVE